MSKNICNVILEKNHRGLFAFILAALISTTPYNAHAVNFLWNNTGTQWTSPTSWTNGVQPTATTTTGTDVVQFSNFGPNFNTVDLTSTRTAQKLEFFSTANAYTFTTGNARLLEIASGGITNASSAVQTFNLRVNNSGGNYTWSTAAGGGLTFNQQVGLTTDSSGTSRTLTLAGDGAYVFNNNLVNNGTSLTPTAKVIYTGNGSITFNGTNVIGGATGGGMDIAGGGTINVNGGTGLGQGLISVTGVTGGATTPIIKINTTNGLSSSSSLKGSTSLNNTGTLDLLGSKPDGVTTFVMNQYQGNNMAFTNHGGYQTVLQFTNLANTLTASSGNSGGRRLFNNSTNLLVQFDGSLDIGSTTADNSMVTGVGDFLFKGSLINTNTSVLRGLTKAGTGKVTMQGVNSYNGETTIQDGVLLVDTDGSIASSASIVSGGTLQVKGTAGSIVVNSGSATIDSGGRAGNVTVNDGGRLGGSGSVGELSLSSGGLLNPGNSPGTLTANSANVLGGSTYNWEISALTGTAGTNWDLLSVTTLLDMSDITGTGTDKWNLVVTGNGAFTGWTDNRSYEYIFAQAADLILASNFSTDFGTDVTSLFNITTSGISSNPNGDFKVVVGSANGLTTLNLVAVAVPEPSTGSLMFFGLGGLLLNRLIRRKVS